MRVYIVVHVEQEQQWIRGVYRSMESAQARLSQTDLCSSGHGLGDGVHIGESGYRTSDIERCISTMRHQVAIISGAIEDGCCEIEDWEVADEMTGRGPSDPLT